MGWCRMPAAVSVLAAAAGALVCWRTTAQLRAMRKQFSNDNVATECADAIARFDLEAVACPEPETEKSQREVPPPRLIPAFLDCGAVSHRGGYIYRPADSPTGQPKSRIPYKTLRMVTPTICSSPLFPPVLLLNPTVPTTRPLPPCSPPAPHGSHVGRGPCRRLDTLPNPNRIQQSFIEIVQLLTEVKPFIPGRGIVGGRWRWD